VDSEWVSGWGRLFGNLFEKVGKAQKVLLPRARTTTADARVVRRLIVRFVLVVVGGRWGWGVGGGLVMSGYERHGAGREKGVYEKR